MAIAPRSLIILHIFSWFPGMSRLSFKLSNLCPGSSWVHSNFFPGSSQVQSSHPIQSFPQVLPGCTPSLHVIILAPTAHAPKFHCVTWFLLSSCLPPCAILASTAQVPSKGIFPILPSVILANGQLSCKEIGKPFFLPTLGIKFPSQRMELSPTEPGNAVAS